MSLRFPRSTFRPLTAHFTPRPGTASKDSALTSFTSAFCACSLLLLQADARSLSQLNLRILAHRSSVKPLNVLMSVTEGSPLVSVPVLSKTTVLSFLAFSTYSPLRKSTPYSAPLPTPARMAVGVAIPKAQGQAISNTASKAKKALFQKPAVRYQIDE